MVGGRALYAEQRDRELFVNVGAEELARHYFALDHPLAEIRATFPADAAMAAASERGNRLLRQFERANPER